ncbi:condensation domain-containing protein [Streptomyces sp. NPDC048045]|uniref:condensation domain-containing protein n=1 Tax=Streptomyces sp. NPDC048045 TaxID=3154710 RepID=UPI003439159A
MNSETGAPARSPDPATARTATTNKEKALWLMEELVPDTGINNLGLALQVGGRLRPDVLKAALAVVLSRYDVLRTVFHANGAELLKEVVPASEFSADIEPLDLSGESLEKDLTAFVDRPFRLDGRPLVRVGLAGGPDGDVLCVGVHHLTFDMISAALFLRTFIPVYDAIAAGRPVPAEATEQTPALAESEPQPADLAYWRETLKGFTPGALDLWCGRQRSRQLLMTGEIARHTLSPEAQHAVLQLQRVARTPVAAVMLAAYAALLASHGAGPDLVVGSPVDVRGTNTSAIGYHVNVVPIRIRVDLAEGFRPLARRARDAFLGAMAHAGTSVDELTGELPEVGSSWQTALFRHLFNFLPGAPEGELSVDGMPARLLTVENPYSKFDLELVGTPSQAEISFRYSSETLDRADVEAMLHRFDALLVAAAHDPERPLRETAGWSESDRRTVDRAHDTDVRADDTAVRADGSAVRAGDTIVLADGSGERADDTVVVADGTVEPAHDTVVRPHDTVVRPHDTVLRALGTAAAAERPTVPALFRSWAQSTPQAQALADGEHTATYRQVDEAAAAIHALLAGAGVGTGDVVALAVPRREAAAAVLGSWRAGAVCLPLDAGHTPAWLTRQLAHSGAKVVLTGTGTQLPADAQLPPVLPLDTAPAPAPATPDEPRAPSAPACLIHTCGDDGQPVATVLSHAGIADTVRHFATELRVEPGTGVLTLAAPATLGSLLDLCLALSAGGRAVIAPDEARTGGPALGEAAGRHDATVVTVPPGTPARLLQDLGGRLHGLTVLAHGGEMSRATAERLLAAGCRLHCAYGTDETTGWAVSGRVTDPDAVTRGRPITRTRAFVTAPDGRELPVGLRGELCLAGTGLALSGPDDPAVPAHERYGRHHRTGELARWRPDGTLELLGRVDRRVVTGDGPVDLGTVEALLLDHREVTAAAAVAVTPPGGEPAVVAFAETAETAETAGNANDAGTVRTAGTADDAGTVNAAGTAGTSGDADGLARLLLAHTQAGLAAPAALRQVVTLDALPRTPDGRTDRGALARLAEKALGQGPGPQDPAADDALVRALVEIWGQLLATEAGARTNFFEAGGHSLLAAVLAQKVEELTGTSLGLTEVFEHPTPAALAARVRA